jgi:hypothetical protein
LRAVLQGVADLPESAQTMVFKRIRGEAEQ